MITITDVAKSKVMELLAAEEQKGLALRVAILGRGPGGFRTAMHFVDLKEKAADDSVVDAGGFQVFVDPKSAENLKGSTIDYVEGPHGSGFKVDNPNPLWTDPLAQKVQEVIDTKVNPGLAGHGGFITLLEVKDGTAYIGMGGGCQGCGMANVTMKEGVEVILKEAVPEIKQVLDTTDHADGKNPYYQAGTGGPPPHGH